VTDAEAAGFDHLACPTAADLAGPSTPDLGVSTVVVSETTGRVYNQRPLVPIPLDAWEEPSLILDWNERCVLMREAPAQTGFGLELIGRGRPGELDVGVEVAFSPPGFRCHIELPLPRRGG
jgi:hypothetical protein